MIKKTIYALLLITFGAMAIFWYMDYEKVNNGFEPKFCLKEKVYLYEDGETKECNGFGYNIFRYNREGNKKTVVGGFWIKLEE